MNTSPHPFSISDYFKIIMFFFTLLVAGSLIWNMNNMKTHLQELAYLEAKTNLDKVGYLRGATDVAIPLEKYKLIEKDNRKKLIITHVLLWLLGMGSIYFLGRRLLHSEKENRAYSQELSIRTKALEQSGSAIMITDINGTIEYVNKAFLDLNCFKRDEVLGKKPVILKSHLNAPALYREMWNTITEGKTWKGEFKNRKKNGTIYWCHETISPIIDTAGIHTHYIAVIEDIEERKIAEEYIKQLVNEKNESSTQQP